jgi:hypothetical protein
LSVAQALAGARLAVGAKAGIEQRFARGDIRGTLAADRERHCIGKAGNRDVPQNSHGMSILASCGRGTGGALSANWQVRE